MLSLRGRFCRYLTKYIIAPKFDPNKSVDEIRNIMESLTKYAKLPSNITVERLDLNGIAAEWIYTDEMRGNKAVLFLHGGGYNICSLNTHREIAAFIADASGAKVLLTDYRLAPEHPFPAALEDATSAYRWLLEVGYNGKHIALAGDSAGGGLAIATANSLRDAGDPPPASIVCMSPWTDLSLTGESIKSKSKIDPMIDVASVRVMAENYVGDGDPRNPLISPLYADLRDLPPMLIHVGSDEILLDDSIRIAKKAEDAGVDVTLKIYQQLWHAFHLNAKIMPEAKSAVGDIGIFIQEHFEK